MKLSTQPRTFRRVDYTRLPTKWGIFQAIGYQWEVCNGTQRIETAVALVWGEIIGNIPLIRIHSQCLTGDALGSLRCDCGEQLELAMRAIVREKSGLLIYEHQEGRGIGLMAKLQAYSLQDKGLDTVEANHALGFDTDHRNFGLPVAILRDLGISRVRILSNNPQKFRTLIDADIDVVERIPCEVAPNPFSFAYLQAKKEKMGHALSRSVRESAPDGRRVRSDEHDKRSKSRTPRQPEQSPFTSIEIALRELRAGRMIVVVDDEERENEGDLVMAAEMITPAAVNFMATHGRGLICLAMTGERLDELRLSPMAPDNTALCGTGFAVSIDLKGNGVSTGISASDRAQTIRAALDARCGPDDFARPGHVFPLRARRGGVFERRGHTEAAVDLARLADLHPSGVICEILNKDGTMARVPDLVKFCKIHELKMITVEDLKNYRMALDSEDVTWPATVAFGDQRAIAADGNG